MTGSATSVVGPSHHFASTSQPRRFSSKADIKFDASHRLVYEYAAWRRPCLVSN
jgi:hypothetical protein